MARPLLRWFDAVVTLLVAMVSVTADSAQVGEDSVGNLVLSSRPGQSVMANGVNLTALETSDAEQRLLIEAQAATIAAMDVRLGAMNDTMAMMHHTIAGQASTILAMQSSIHNLTSAAPTSSPVSSAPTSSPVSSAPSSSPASMCAAGQVHYTGHYAAAGCGGMAAAGIGANGLSCNVMCGGNSIAWSGMAEMEGFCRSVSQRFRNGPPTTIHRAEDPNHSYPLFEAQEGGRCKLNADGTTPHAGGFTGNGDSSYGDIVLCKCGSGTRHTVLGAEGGFRNGFCAA